MSNELIEIKNALSKSKIGLDEDTLAIIGKTNGRKRISIKAGTFRKYVGGKQVATIEDRYLNVIFVKANHTQSRTYYAGAYEEGSKAGPACWSQDAQTPAPEVKNAPAKSCKECPFSIKGSARDGKSSACKYSWRTAIVLPNDPSGDVMQLIVPHNSIWGPEDAGRRPFKTYVDYLGANEVSLGRVVTKVQFDINSPAPRLLFSPVTSVTDELAETLKAQGKTSSAEEAVKMTMFQSDTPVVENKPQILAEAVPASETPEEAPKVREKKSPQASNSEELLNKWAGK
jgi:hypothetical protein